MHHRSPIGDGARKGLGAQSPQLQSLKNASSTWLAVLANLLTAAVRHVLGLLMSESDFSQVHLLAAYGARSSTSNELLLQLLTIELGDDRGFVRITRLY